MLLVKNNENQQSGIYSQILLLMLSHSTYFLFVIRKNILCFKYLKTTFLRKKYI